MGASPVKSRNIEVFPKKLWIHNSALTNEIKRAVGHAGGISASSNINDIILPGTYNYGGEKTGETPPTNAPSAGHAILIVFRSSDYGAQFWVKDREEAGAHNLYFRKGHSLDNPNGNYYWHVWQTIVTLDLL